MFQLRTLLTRYGIDALIVAVAAASVVGTPLREDAQRPDGALLWLETLGLALVALVLLLRRRWPFAAPAATWLLAALLSFLDGRLVVSQPGIILAGMGAALLLGNVRSDRQARTGLAIVLSAAAIVVYNDPLHSTGDFFFTPVLFVTGWMVGFALRGRAEQTEAAEQRAALAEHEREVAARIAVAEERSRIARELHDVVAHAVSVMVLQVGAVRHRMPDSEAEDREALKNVEEAGRAALAEMRRLLGAMRRDGEQAELQPQPGLGGLDALLSDVRATGLDVRLQVHGEPVDLPPALDLSAYRILQEGLTNALKHSGAQHAQVDVTYGDRDLLVKVTDDGCGHVSSDGLGHGLVGIRERVKIYGGDMSAGTENGRGFTLSARLPLRDGG
ncbi:MAG TPA: sensor histidine kinase [Nocardioidaceae bacterium]|nr:sensor histidine kinase [Nocardioidaceae bacterium]